jgi:hypothetical protein
VLSPVTDTMSLDCRKILQAAGAVLPDQPLAIPTAAMHATTLPLCHS